MHINIEAQEEIQKMNNSINIGLSGDEILSLMKGEVVAMTNGLNYVEVTIFQRSIPVNKHMLRIKSLS